MAETVTVGNLRLVNPRGTDLGSGEFHLNERPGDLNGKTLGLLENHKANSDKVLHRLGEILKEKYDLHGVVLTTTFLRPEQAERLSQFVVEHDLTLYRWLPHLKFREIGAQEILDEPEEDFEAERA